MRPYLFSSLFLFSVVGVGALLSRHEGWYNAYWFVDVILHTISGIAFGLMWLGIERQAQHSLVRIAGTVSFAAFGSVLWEFWEFAGWRITPTHARFYIPELGDTLGDIACGIAGGLLVSVIYVLLKRPSRK